MFIHTFGAYFGLACSWMVTNGSRTKDHKNNSSMYHSDCFMVARSSSGSSGLLRERARLRQCAESLHRPHSAVALRVLHFRVRRVEHPRPDHKFDMVDVQNATLAGGVTIGAVADHYLGGGGALFIGAAAGLSTSGWWRPAGSKKRSAYTTPAASITSMECLECTCFSPSSPSCEIRCCSLLLCFLNLF